MNNEIVPAPDVPPEQDKLRDYLMVIYILYAVSVATGLTLLVGVIIAYVKRDDFYGTPYFDHIQYLIKTFWITLIGSLIGALTMFLLIGFLILTLVFVWFIYRVVVGFVKFYDNKPISSHGWL
ncbi:DUF4870 family protein [Neisseria sp.]|uniref:DUF4870 family protein n=1 Tax=Neisseria sp. TaxID=192066 RepID=UPI0035A1A4EB